MKSHLARRHHRKLLCGHFPGFSAFWASACKVGTGSPIGSSDGRFFQTSFRFFPEACFPKKNNEFITSTNPPYQLLILELANRVSVYTFNLRGVLMATRHKAVAFAEETSRVARLLSAAKLTRRAKQRSCRLLF